jgi:hypothetical protein
VNRAPVGPVERELLEHHRHVLVRDTLAYHEAHHLEDRLVAGRRRQRRAAVAILAEHLDREIDDCRALGRRSSGLDLVQHRCARADAALEQARSPLTWMSDIISAACWRMRRRSG